MTRLEKTFLKVFLAIDVIVVVLILVSFENMYPIGG